jgi:endoglucanase
MICAQSITPCSAAAVLRRWLGAVIVGLLALWPAAAIAAADDPAFATAQRMARGVNILGFDGIWDGGTDAPFRLATLGKIREAGFGHVRINLFGFKYMDGANVIAPEVLADLDRVLDAAIGAGLVPVIDEHDNEICQNVQPDCAPKLLAFWTQISERYAGRYPEAVFEILNEPGWKMTTAQWNALSGRALKLIRASNPDRTVIVAALNTEDPAGAVRALKLPKADRNIIVTVHYYKPFHFTHQGAPWAAELAALHDIDWGSAADQQAVVNDLGGVAKWAGTVGRPVYLGEFGVYEGAPAAARARYASFLARTAESLGWPWAYWQFDHDFALFDEDTQQWVAPLLAALVPAN